MLIDSADDAIDVKENSFPNQLESLDNTINSNENSPKGRDARKLSNPFGQQRISRGFEKSRDNRLSKESEKDSDREIDSTKSI